MTKAPSKPRCAALVGPYLSGKTTLLEAILATTGAVTRKGTVKEGTAVGDGTAEARARQMSTEINLATTDYLGDPWTFVDCPGSIELMQDGINALMAVDVAVVVCEPEPDKTLTISRLLRFLDEHDIPHMIFINKMEVAHVRLRDTIAAMQKLTSRPLVLREVPIRDDATVTGFVDLVSQRAFKWVPGQHSERIEMPDAVKDRVAEARTTLLESYADFDDSLLEKLLEEEIPGSEEIYGFATRPLQENRAVPVFFGSSDKGFGVTRLLKALRHESPEDEATAKRLGVDLGGEPKALVFKTLHAAHTGKMSFARLLAGEIVDGATLNGVRVSGVYRVLGQKQDKQARAGIGEVVALGRMDEIRTGDLLSPSGKAGRVEWPEILSPVYSFAIHAEQRADEVKLTGALAKLAEEDPSLSFETSPDTGELLIWGQGEMHLSIALDRLKNRFNLAVTRARPQTPYKETIRGTTRQHARHKKQSGGHGEFGDIHIEVKPLPRGSGFKFTESITGGAVPKNYIPAVETGVTEFLARGPLGFPVVDISVDLFDGQYHAVDSSDMAFRKAAILGMKEALPKCGPVLLEPIFQVDIAVPTEFTSKVQRIVAGHRGQIQGYDTKPGWEGWDEVKAQMPQSEIHNLIIDLRSATLGVGTFQWRFDHLQELAGREADQIVQQRAKENQ